MVLLPFLSLGDRTGILTVNSEVFSTCQPFINSSSLSYILLYAYNTLLFSLTSIGLGNFKRLCIHHHHRTAELERTLWIIESSPCEGATVGNQTLNLWLHSQRPKPVVLNLCYSGVFELQLPETPASRAEGEGFWELQSKNI